MLFWGVSTPSVLLLCLGLVSNICVDAHNSLRRRYVRDEKQNCIQLTKRMPRGTTLYKDPACSVQFVASKLQARTAKLTSGKYAEKRVTTIKPHHAISDKIGKVLKSTMKNSSAINIKQKSRRSISNRKNKKSGRTARMKKRNTPQPLICSEQVLEAERDTDLCSIINKTTGRITLVSVRCSEYSGCYMIADQDCLRFRNGEWKATNLDYCDIKDRVARVVEVRVSKNGRKVCEVNFGANIDEFDYATIFTRKNLCYNTYYALIADECVPFAIDSPIKAEAVFRLKRDCEDALLTGTRSSTNSIIIKGRKVNKKKMRSPFTDCLLDDVPTEECQKLRITNEPDEDLERRVTLPESPDVGGGRPGFREPNPAFTRSPQTGRPPFIPKNDDRPTIRVPMTDRPQRTNPTIAARRPFDREPDIVVGENPLFATTGEHRRYTVVYSNPSPHRIDLYEYPPKCAVPNAPGKCVDTKKYHELVKNASLSSLISPLKAANLALKAYNANHNQTIGELSSKFFRNFPAIMDHINDKPETVVTVLMGSLPLLLNNRNCSQLLQNAPFNVNFLVQSISACDQ